MTLKQKIYNFLATVNDYKGLHATANLYRNGDEKVGYAIFDLLTLGTFPLGVLIMFILTHRFHKPNCNCDYMKKAKIINESDKWSK